MSCHGGDPRYGIGGRSTSSGRIAYYRTAPPCKTVGGDRVCEKGIWTAEVDGTNERRLTPSKLGVGFPSWSPTGRRIAYMAATGRKGIGELWVMNEGGGGKQRLPIAAPYFPDLDSFVGSWSRDEKTIAVAATRLEGVRARPSPRPSCSESRWTAASHVSSSRCHGGSTTPASRALSCRPTAS